MKKNLALVIAMGVMGNLYAMNNGGSSSSSKKPFSEWTSFDEVNAKGGMTKNDFLEAMKQLQDAATEHHFLMAERDVLATVFKERLKLKDEPQWETPLISTNKLQVVIYSIAKIAYEEKKETIIPTDSLLNNADDLIRIVIDNTMLKSQIMIMRKVLGIDLLH